MIETAHGTLVTKHYRGGVLIGVVPAKYLHTFWLARKPDGDFASWDSIWPEVRCAMMEAFPSFRLLRGSCSISDADYTRMLLMAV